MNFRGGFLIVGVIVVSGLFFTPTAGAGFLDKLNAATNKLNNYSQTVEQRTQQMENAAPKGSGKAKKFEKTKTSNPITGEWGNQVTCEGPNSATCANGLDDMANCMHQGKGYYYRLVAVNLEEKIKNPDWSADERTMLQTDIDSVKAAIETNQVVDPDPNEPQRWLSYLSKEDQREINRVNSKYMNEVRKICDDRFGGMARYSSGK